MKKNSKKNKNLRNYQNQKEKSVFKFNNLYKIKSQNNLKNMK